MVETCSNPLGIERHCDQNIIGEMSALVETVEVPIGKRPESRADPTPVLPSAAGGGSWGEEVFYAFARIEAPLSDSLPVLPERGGRVHVTSLLVSTRKLESKLLRSTTTTPTRAV
jgi:hypothetical protein